jgi:hypothetical protein
MAKISPIFIVPSDTPPSVEYVKKLCIFFPKIVIPHSDDRALIHEKDVVEKFPSMEIFWAERNAYPRSESYEEVISEIIESSSIMQRRGAIQILGKEDIKNAIDPGVHHVTFMGVTTDPKLVASAIPDASSDFEPKLTGYMRGFEISQGGCSSKYSRIGLGEAAVIKNIPEAWSYLAHLRLGRFFKYNTIASVCGYNSYYYDAINESIARLYNNQVNGQGNESADNISDYFFFILVVR